MKLDNLKINYKSITNKKLNEYGSEKDNFKDEDLEPGLSFGDDLKEYLATGASVSSVGFGPLSVGVGNSWFVEVVLAYGKIYALNQTKDDNIVLVGIDNESVRFYKVILK